MRTAVFAGLLLFWAGAAGAQDLGQFEGQSDVGSVVPAGTASHEQGGDYTLTAAGANVWARVDAFHYLWKKMSGDVVLTADVAFPPVAYSHPPAEHRKAMLMIRQSLDPGSQQVSIHVHGIGMTALQHRDRRGANTQSTEINIALPRTVRLEKRGDTFTMFVSQTGEPLHPVGASLKLHFAEPFYVGLGVTSHDPDTTDKVEFHNVRLEALPAAPPPSALVLNSSLQILQVEDSARRATVIAAGPGRMSSPDWMPGDKNIYVYKDSQILRIPLLDPLNGGKPEVVDTAGLADCAGDYGVSPDGKSIGLSCAQAHGGVRNLYVLPFGGKPRQLTSGEPSFFHGWSADGSTLLFTRGKPLAADFFSVPAAGGAQKRLTSDTLEDGPEFSPDGKYIYFDSSRSGVSQIWRMNADGSGAVQLTDDGMTDLSPHVSPDGAYVAWLQLAPDGGTDMQDASIQLLSVKDGAQRTLIKFRAYRGSFTMPVWGDKDHLALVSYQMLPAKDNGASQ